MQPHFNFHRPAAHHRTRPGVGPQFQSGDVVSWRNPSTGAHHDRLTVEFVYPTYGVVLVRGDFGRLSLKSGLPSLESRRVRMEQVTLEARAQERA
jgi:hypothetical protein